MSRKERMVACTKEVNAIFLKECTREDGTIDSEALKGMALINGALELVFEMDKDIEELKDGFIELQNEISNLKKIKDKA